MRELDPRRTTYSQSPLNEPWLTKTINILCFFWLRVFFRNPGSGKFAQPFWLILKPYKTFMHKHTFSGPGARLKRARTLGPEKSRTLEFSNPADPDLGPGEFENHMKCFHVLTNPTHEMNFDLCFFFVQARNVPCSCSNRVRVHAYTNLWISYTHTFRVLNLENTQTHTG